MKKYLALGGCALGVILLVLVLAPGSPWAGTKVGVPQFPAGIAVGDNYAEDTLWVMGHIKIDSTASFGANLTVAYITVTDSLLVSTGKIFFSSGSSLYADSVHFNDNVHFASGKKVYLGGGLTFTGGLVTLDSLEGNKLFRFDKGANIKADSLLIFSGGRIDIDSLRAVKKVIMADGSTILGDSIAALDGFYFPKNSKVWGDSTLFLTKARLDADSVRVVKKGIFADGSTTLLDSVVVADGFFFPKGSKIWGDSLLILTKARLDVDSVRVTKKMSVTNRITAGSVKPDTLRVGSDEVFIPMVFEAESLAANQTIAIWTWPRDYTVKSVQINSLTAPDDTIYAEVLFDTLGGTSRDTVMIKGAEKAKTLTPAAWLEESAEGCTLRTYLGSGTSGGLKGTIIVWLKLR